MTRVIHRLVLLQICLTTILPIDEAYGQRGERRDRGAESNRADIQETKLLPVFPSGYQCPKITSAFAATSDGAGNIRDLSIHGGKHGGVDVGFNVGNPLIAISGGEVIAKGPASGNGAQMEGIFLWLRHSPEDTGLAFWTFSKYQHLKQPSPLNIGDRVKPGQVVAIGGDTGTYSRKFGTSLPHLHMSTFLSECGEYEVIGSNKNIVKARDPLHVDMMVLFIKGISLERARNEPTHEGIEKSLPVATSSWEGAPSDPSARLFWPVACK